MSDENQATEPVRVRFLDWPVKRANNVRPLRVSRKTWSAKDPDHIPRGQAVLLRREPQSMHESLRYIHLLVGAKDAEATRSLRGTVERRWMDGSYFVHLDGTRFTVSVDRADIIYPVPENVVPLRRVGT